jgi:hypothetical protein
MMLAKRSVVLVALALFVAGCSSGGGKQSATATTKSVPTTASSHTTLPPPSTTTALAPAVTAVNPKVTVTPDRDLTDGERIRVNVAGFGVGGKVFLSECASASDVTDLGCGQQLPEQPFLVTDDTRAGSGSFVVHDPAAVKGYNTTDVQRCLSQCVLVATIGGIGPHPYAYTSISFAHEVANKAAARCTPSQLSATFGFVSNAQVGLGGILLTNHGPSPCTLSGSPDVRVIDGYGNDLMLGETHGQAGNTPLPPPRVPITIAANSGLPHGGVPMDWFNWCRPSPGALTLDVRFPGWATVRVATPTDNAYAPPPCFDKKQGSGLRVDVIHEIDANGYRNP